MYEAYSVMNRIAGFFFFGGLFLILFFGCDGSGKKSGNEETLELNANLFEFGEKENSAFIVVSSNTKWTATSSVAWLGCSPASGEGNLSIKLTAEASDVTDVRSGAISVSTIGGVSKTVQVTQAGLEPFITIDPKSASAQGAGEEITVTVTASGAWTANIPENAKAWISTKTKTDTQAVLDVAPNTSGVDRSATLSFKLNRIDKQTSFAVSQRRILTGITIFPEQANIADLASEVAVNVTADISWKVSIPAVASWVKVKQQTSAQIVFSVDLNLTGASRTANIDFQMMDGTTVTTCKITQAKGYDLMSPIFTVDNQTRINDQILINNGTTFISNGWDYSEYPKCTGNGCYPSGTHLQVINYPNFPVAGGGAVSKNTLRFWIHINQNLNGAPPWPIIGYDAATNSGYIATNDRGGSNDRQRNELKSANTNASGNKDGRMQGHWGERQIIKWKIRIPKGYVATNRFCHIHQIKAEDGANGAPLITVSLRDGGGKPMRLTAEHSAEESGVSRGEMAYVNLTEVEDQWIQIEQEMRYFPQRNLVQKAGEEGFYRIKITRISDNKVLMDFQRDDIEMVRKNATKYRSKFGIYRSLDGDMVTSPNNIIKTLKTEYIDMCDIEIWRKDHNPDQNYIWYK